ncbi:class I SAM-dependent methyltransferase [Halorhodospira neutriphila]|uniref:SAM-dependent methyltransferase n=1 Tax=Halorhodospira neutriphila TaxID=168379 RepID=A0ABS1E3R7_9GAMM|nr:methyltransferase domain-containing protein [Halorhodospira neutriphila]MBK1726125.1 SAM-dependent methyltransferase [Halorhodospira neutriphila]
MDLSSIRSAYRRYAGFYDQFFGPIFAPGRKLAMGYLNAEPGRRVLEVGVGTGISLPEYRRDVGSVVGVDVSPDMLKIARKRVDEQGLDYVEGLYEMDAEALEFPDDSFDVVVAMYVASVVPNPQRLLEELQRVCRPGGDVLIINHFASQNPVLRRMEQALQPLSKLLGFRPDMELSDLPELPDFEQVAVRPSHLFGYWKLVHYRNGAGAAGDGEGRAAA